jgi:hypothetical protein
MTGSIVVGERFCGPPGTGNGGYVSGLVAAQLDTAAEVTLRAPVPLGVPLTVARTADGVRVTDGATLVAEAGPAGPVSAPPEPVPIADAREAAARSRLRLVPGDHPYPHCFVCGSARNDGLGIMVGPVAGRDVAADVWCPDAGLAGTDGVVRDEFVWAVLDCSGGLGAFGDTPNGLPYLLGRMTIRRTAPVRAGTPHVVLGWRESVAGRKMIAGSALYTEGGDAVAVARAIWIRLNA